MKGLRRCIGTCLLLWGCTASQPQQEIMATFQSFLVNVKAGDQEKILLTAPFLARLPAEQREVVFQTFRRLATWSSRLHMAVSQGAKETYLLQVSAPGDSAPILVPFRRNDRGQWEMSPVLEAIQHIDIVPAR